MGLSQTNSVTADIIQKVRSFYKRAAESLPDKQAVLQALGRVLCRVLNHTRQAPAMAHSDAKLITN